jgi:hypothetical protein
MTYTKESAESNVEPIKFITLTLVSATAPKDSTLCKESAQNANLERLTTNTNNNVPLLPAKDLMNSTQLLLKLVSVFLNMSEFKEYAPTALLDTTMIATVTDVFVNLVSSKKEDSVILSVKVTKLTSMENANATMEFLFTMENVSLL